jgi:hypothetical protein
MGDVSGQMSGASGQMGDVSGQMSGASGQMGDVSGQMSGTSGQMSDMRGQLAEAFALRNRFAHTQNRRRQARFFRDSSQLVVSGEPPDTARQAQSTCGTPGSEQVSNIEWHLCNLGVADLL